MAILQWLVAENPPVRHALWQSHVLHDDVSSKGSRKSEGSVGSGHVAGSESHLLCQKTSSLNMSHVWRSLRGQKFMALMPYMWY